MSRFMKKAFQDFDSYTPGEQKNDGSYCKLNTNESPFTPAPAVVQALADFDADMLRLYPDPTGRVLKEKLAAMHGVAPENIFLSNGSDDIINFAVLAFVDQDEEVVFPEISYSFYDVIAALHCVNVRRIPMAEGFSIDPEDYCDLNQNIVIANPNAPTGLALSSDQIRRIAASNPDHLVLIDEAYVDFGAETVIPLISEYDNLLVSRTFSKYAGFAGGRLGYAIGSKDLISDLTTIQYSTNPYNINRISMRLAEAIVDSDDYYRVNAGRIAATRARVCEKLQSMGFEVIPSKANFVFVRHASVDGGTIYEELKKRFVLVRHFDKAPISDYIRVSIGSDRQMDLFINKLQEVLSINQASEE